VDKVIGAIIVVALIATAVTLMALGWRARRRRQSALGTVAEAPVELGDAGHTEELLYVATTRADAPLDRITIAGLGFRARATLTVFSDGVLLELVGETPVYLPKPSLVGVGVATWTVDRVVERDGLVFVRWRLGGDAAEPTVLDSYLRSSHPEALLDALRPLVPATIESAPE
jgi:hypothetical protein